MAAFNREKQVEENDGVFTDPAVANQPIAQENPEIAEIQTNESPESAEQPASSVQAPAYVEPELGEQDTSDPNYMPQAKRTVTADGYIIDDYTQTIAPEEKDLKAVVESEPNDLQK